MTISSAEPVTTWSPPDLRLTPSVIARNEARAVAESDAWQRGWDEGHAAATAEARARLAASLSAADAAARALGDAAAAMQMRIGAALHPLALGIARHLVEREVAADPSVMQHLVQRALALAPLHGPLAVRLHPDDMSALHGIAAITELAVEGVELRWTPDASLTRGSCVIDGPSAIVDGRVDRALLDLYEQLGHD